MNSDESPHYTGEEKDEGCKRRRMAMKLFLSSPLLAMQEFPELIEELRVFFLNSSNPHQDKVTGEAAYNCEDLFHQWTAAKHWAQQGEGQTSGALAEKEPAN